MTTIQTYVTSPANSEMNLTQTIAGKPSSIKHLTSMFSQKIEEASRDEEKRRSLIKSPCKDILDQTTLSAPNSTSALSPGSSIQRSVKSPLKNLTFNELMGAKPAPKIGYNNLYTKGSFQ
ncbi:phrB [Acrasis kona]|uniref:PhrB n=1 Tax=Acrasis kona TaxID=1008807 RepID=A0AAW2YHB1_9EUKA